MTRRKRWILAGFVMIVIGGMALAFFGRPLWQPVYVKLTGGRTVEQVVERLGPDAESRLSPHFERAGVAYPPTAITLIGLKEEEQLELWAADEVGGWTLVHRYPVLAASGVAGPKLREGDRQVPEGVYRIEGLNPNSSYHLSMKLDYPNAWDRARAAEDGRSTPGTNIFIHGKAASIGCLAMGDPVIEELFILVERVGIENVEVILLPHDPRERALTPGGSMPPWTARLYRDLDEAMQPFAVTQIVRPDIGSSSTTR